MGRQLSEAKTLLILSLRHLGDAVVLAGVVNALHANRSDLEIDILGRSDLQGVTERFCRIRDYIPADFLVFGHHKKNLGSVLGAVRKLLAVRRRKYDACLNLTGDVRENLIASMAGAAVTAAPLWPAGHPFRKHIRIANLPGMVSHPVPIQATSRSYYAAMEDFLRQAGGSHLCWPANEPDPVTDRQVIALHPGASHDSKRWSADKWKQLIRALRAHGYRLRLYGSRSEDAGLRREYAAEIADCGVEIVTGDIAAFITSLSGAALLVGMDSFAVHAAHALGIPSVVLHGPYDPSVMTPPSGIALSAGAMCPAFPCYKGKACSNAAARYICVRGIEVTEVAIAVRAICERVRPGVHQ